MSKKKEITKKAGSSGSTGESSPLLKKFIIVAGVTVIGTVVCMGLRSGMTETVYPAKDASKYFYIQDYSGVFSEKAEKYIFDEAVKLNKATTAQIVVMAVPDTDSESLEQYSLRTANNLGIGSKEKDNGILILFTTTSPHVRMEVGKGLEGTIPDARAGRILDDYAVEPKNKRHWNEAAMNTFTATAEILYQDSNIKAPESLQLVKDTDETEPGKTFADMTLPEGKPVTEGEDFTTQLINGFLAFIAMLLFMFLPLYGIFVYFRNMFSGGGGSYSGGSYSGGSSYSGHSYGGGGYSSGGHSGGGGSFGGGGASR